MAIYQDPLPNHQQQQAQPQQPPQQQQNQTANINTIFTDEELSPKRWKPSPGPNWEREESPVECKEPVPKDESLRNQVTLEEPATTHIAVNDACNPNRILRPPQAANASSPAPRVRYAPPQSPTSPPFNKASSTPVLRPPTNPPSSPTPILKPIKSILQLSTIATPAEASTSNPSPSTQSTISDESACTMQPEDIDVMPITRGGKLSNRIQPPTSTQDNDEEATPMEEDEVLKKSDLIEHLGKLPAKITILQLIKPGPPTSTL